MPFFFANKMLQREIVNMFSVKKLGSFLKNGRAIEI